MHGSMDCKNYCLLFAVLFASVSAEFFLATSKKKKKKFKVGNNLNHIGKKK